MTQPKEIDINMAFSKGEYTCELPLASNDTAFINVG
jgi:hypothetical protein